MADVKLSKLCMYAWEDKSTSLMITLYRFLSWKRRQSVSDGHDHKQLGIFLKASKNFVQLRLTLSANKVIVITRAEKSTESSEFTDYIPPERLYSENVDTARFCRIKRYWKLNYLFPCEGLRN